MTFAEQIMRRSRVVRHFRSRTLGAAAAVALTVLAAACTSSSTSAGPKGAGSSSGPSSSASSSNALTSGQQALNPGTGTPQKGGTLNEVGISDVAFMDYDTAYYSTDDQVMRLTVRSLYGWGNTPSTTTTPEPDLATAAPQVSADGKTVTVTIRSGVLWNTTPARAVTAADVVRGIKRACNNSPVYFGGMADFANTIEGLSAFCKGYPKAAAGDAKLMKQYIESHTVPGIVASGNTLTFKLTQPAAWLEGAMTLAPFSAVPIEAENALPGTPGVYNHMYSDGPYQMVSYTPKKSIKFTRNPVWKASTDPLRHAYVDAINVDETGDQTTIYQEISTNTPQLGMTWDALAPPADVTSLVNQVKQGSKDAGLYATYSSNPYVVFNTVSPNNGGALGKAVVRQALSYGLDRLQLIKTQGGTQANIPLTHVISGGQSASDKVPANYDPYPYDQAKAKSLLASAGFTASHKLTLKYLYRSQSQGGTKLFQNIQAQLNDLGSVNVVGVPTNQSDFYAKYLQDTSSPSAAQKGVWDFSGASWSPDWFTNGTLTWLIPLFSSHAFPVNQGSNFGIFADPAVDSLITQALAQPTEDQADTYWAQADEAVMKAAAIYPIADKLELGVHASYVHNAVYIPIMQQFDAANVWLSNS
jgi:peptide/nickel transport system substrate-binding protein